MKFIKVTAVGGSGMKKLLLAALLVISLMVFTGCIGLLLGNFGSGTIQVDKKDFERNYVKIRQVIIEECQNSGFQELKQEVKPTKYNNWKGTINLRTTTQSGEDSIYINFNPKENDKIEIYIHGGGMVAKPDAAINAIKDRISRL